MSSVQPPELAPCLGYRASMTVEAGHTVPEADPRWPGFADMPPVLSAGQHTVAVHVEACHLAATPVGMTVTA